MKKQITALLLALSLAVPLGLSAFAEEPSPEKDAPDSQESAVAGPDAEPEADYEPDPLGQVRFSSVEQRIRENNLQILALNEQIAALEEIDYEKQLDKLRRALNSLAGSQWTMLEMGMGSSLTTR